jgi:hypothetical protein
MPYEELLKWSMYFEKRPIGWREDDRTMKLLQVQGVTAKPEEIFMSMAIMKQSNKPNIPVGSVSTESIKNSPLFHAMINAKNGNKLECIENM